MSHILSNNNELNKLFDLSYKVNTFVYMLCILIYRFCNDYIKVTFVSFEINMKFS